MSNLVKHAEREMKLAGLYTEDSDYAGEIPNAVLKLVKAHSSEEHSGGSHGLTLEIFNKVINFQNLTPLTDNPSEWKQCGSGGQPMWQNSRNSAAFSKDAGRTHYLLSDSKKVINSKPFVEVTTTGETNA